MCTKFVYMGIIVDNRKTNILYVDKENNHVANNNEVTKLINIGNTSPIDIYVAIIAGNFNLNVIEVETLKYIINYNTEPTTGQVCDAVSKTVNKSTATIARAIGSLRRHRLIYVNGTNNIYLSASINIDRNALRNSKFIVIEVNPETTSGSISI